MKNLKLIKWITKKINPTIIKHIIKIFEHDEEIVERYINIIMN